MFINPDPCFIINLGLIGYYGKGISTVMEILFGVGTRSGYQEELPIFRRVYDILVIDTKALLCLEVYVTKK